MKLRIIFLLLICIFVSCEEPKKDDDPIKIKNEAVFILNEGNMGYGNASIDLYDPATGEVDRKVFFKNNGRPLGVGKLRVTAAGAVFEFPMLSLN